MADDANLRKLVGEAWGLHRNSQNEDAIATFDKVLNQDPRDIDALYGKGLALRSMGQSDKAIEALKSAYEESRRRLDELRAKNEADGVSVANNLSLTEDDRLMMFIRMAHQRLHELGADLGYKMETF
jgi:tetratricopeptide (TPR) repeat protein